MHRRPQTAGLSAVMLGLIVAILSPAAVAAHDPIFRPSAGRAWTPDAAVLAHTAKQAVKAGTTDERCTGWRSTSVPPPTINVLRTTGPDTGHTETVDLKSYVRTVMGAEWPGFWPEEASKAGAIAVKQYGWYYTIVYRGGKDVDGVCYDVQDNTNDQTFQPETRTPSGKQRRAIEATWDITLRKYQSSKESSRFFLTGYRSGTTKVCAADRDKYHLFQHSVYGCANLGWTYEQILRAYLSHLEVVQRGRHDIVGLINGDASVLSAVDAKTLIPRIYPMTKPAGLRIADLVTEPSVAAGGLRGTISADLDGDRDDDLVTLDATGGQTLEIDAALSDDTTGYGHLTPWWSGDVGAPTADAQMVAGDFDADQLMDIGVVVPGSDPGTARLLVFGNPGSGDALTDPVTRWSGSLDLATSRVWAGDVNGDGRADLIARIPLDGGGVRYLSALSPTPTGVLGPLNPRVDAPDLSPDRLIEVVSDADRDGRDDLWLVYGADGGTRVDLLRAVGTGFQRSSRWSASQDVLPFDRVKVATADVNADGMGDLLLYKNLGDGAGTRILTLNARYGGISAGPSLDDPSLDWTNAQPY